MENENIPDVGFSLITGVSGVSLVIRFVDGQREIPPHIVEFFGAEALASMAKLLEAKNYDEFLAGYHKLYEKQYLNNFQDQFVAGHFGGS